MLNTTKITPTQDDSQDDPKMRPAGISRCPGCINKVCPRISRAQGPLIVNGY